VLRKKCILCGNWRPRIKELLCEYSI
jgi:hypothetical protein